MTAACGGEQAGTPADGQTWEGTVETAANVTTVRTVSGSVWGGTATLVEEASIGVDVGEEPYMFGAIAGLWATEERIYVVDFDIPAVRIYDLDGDHIMDIGGEGEGPGEFRRPNSVVVDGDGRIYVKEGSPGGRVNVYGEDGESVDTLLGDPMLGSAWPLVPTRDGSIYTPVRGNPGGGPGDRRSGMAIPGPGGTIGEPIVVPTLDFEFEGVRVNERAVLNVPFSPHHAWRMSPTGAIVVGITGDYRFEIHAPDGHVTIVERSSEPIPVDPDEADWQRRSVIRSGRNFQEGWSWDGAEIPRVMPAWSGLTVDAGGRTWIRRRGPSRRIDDCDEDPLEVVNGRPRSCWESDVTFEVFGEDGKFLGPVEVPSGVTSLLGAYIRDSVFIVDVEDGAGTPMVKRYRIVLP